MSGVPRPNSRARAGTGWWGPVRPSYNGPMAPEGGQLDGKVVLVSGGASDIGRATALRLAGRGRRGRGRRRVAGRRSLGGRGGRRRGPGRRAALRRPPRGVGRRLRRARHRRVRDGIDAVDHNAAWSHPRLDTDAVGVDLGVWERAIEITTRGALLLARHAIPVMMAGGGGSIVTISSGTSTIGESTRVAYGVSKAALNQLTRAPGRPLRARRHPRQRHRPRLHPHRDRGGPSAGRRAGAPGRGQPDPAPRAHPTTSPVWWCFSAATPRPT